ncbi:hypothetical protein [Psittacicella hinzii]|uniref:Uncharacterized protein n=1 Tax=Psittacicella hinzii TaxID=2028575 RepID=A0A3A1YP93_9GAMM|nr:hypothetical protein [Psittacicella hinzii]RIY38780.1 hypothetical protein CKF58_03450 [Psittacicella hinzii]
MSFILDDFLHKPQIPELANRPYYEVVQAVAPSLNPPHAILRTVEQLAKGLVFDHLVNVGDTKQQTFLNLAKSGLIAASPYVPYVFLYKNSNNQASLTGTYFSPEQNILPTSIHRAITTFHQRMTFDVNFINQQTVKQVALLDLGLPYSVGLSLKETVELFRDTFASFVQFPQLADLYRRFGYAGSQVITNVTTNPDMSWNVSCKLLLVLNAFNGEEEHVQLQAQAFANEFTNIWVNALAHVVGLEDQEQLQELANNISENFVKFTFHCFPENILNATPDVNQQLFGLEHFIQQHHELIAGLTEEHIKDDSLQVPALGQLSPVQLLRLSCSPVVNKKVQQWAINKWLEYVNVFALGDNAFLPDQYYLYVLEYGREAFTGEISQARQDYFFKLNRENDNELVAKIPSDLLYTLINPCILDTTILNLAETQPDALAFYFQLLIDLHNNVLGQLVDTNELLEQGYTNIFLPVEWLWLCGYIAPDLIQIGVELSKQEELNLDAEVIQDLLRTIEEKVNSWINAGYLHEKAVKGELELSPRRQILQQTVVNYRRFDLSSDVLPTHGETLRPSAILAADVFNLAFDQVSQAAVELSREAHEKLSPEAYAKQQASAQTAIANENKAQGQLVEIVEAQATTAEQEFADKVVTKSGVIEELEANAATKASANEQVNKAEVAKEEAKSAKDTAKSEKAASEKVPSEKATSEKAPSEETATQTSKNSKAKTAKSDKAPAKDTKKATNNRNKNKKG